MLWGGLFVFWGLFFFDNLFDNLMTGPVPTWFWVNNHAITSAL